MNITDKKPKYTYDDLVKFIITHFQIGRNPLELVGSSSLQSQKYPSDFDLITSVSNKTNSETFFNNINSWTEIIDENPNLYFIELKIQTKKGEKFRYFNYDLPINYSDFKTKYKNVASRKAGPVPSPSGGELDFIKLDLIAYIDNIFKDVSIIYSFGEPPTTIQKLKKLNEDMEQFKKENNWFKVLKRLFVYYSIKDNKRITLYLNEIFNSKLGELYAIINNIKTIEILMEYYDSPDIETKVLLNLKEIGLYKDRDNLGKIKQDYEEILNKNSKKVMENLK
jgi:hypothetical protein